eukprot:Platyproteum_vivax@DN5773_c0_g2_i1.p1
MRAVRNLKSTIISQNIAGDPVGKSRKELDEMNKYLSALERGTKRMEAGMKEFWDGMLEVEKCSRAYHEKTSYKFLIEDLFESMHASDVEKQRMKEDYGVVHAEISAISSSVKEAQKQLSAREKEFVNFSHYETKVERLTEKERMDYLRAQSKAQSKRPSPQSTEASHSGPTKAQEKAHAKLNRNSDKRQRAQDEFETKDKATREQVAIVLATKFQKLNGILMMLFDNENVHHVKM